MIYCVVPVALADELYGKLVAYYESDSNVQVIIDRRSAERRTRRGMQGQPSGNHHRMVRDRRRARITGEFPPVQVGGVADL